MNTREKTKFEEGMIDVQPVKASRIGVGFNEEDFVIIIGYDDENGEKREFVTSMNPKGLQGLISGLFDAGKEFQKSYNKDIGFSSEEE